MRLDVYHHFDDVLTEADRKLNRILGLLQALTKQETIFMATLDETLADVKAEGTVVGGLATLTAGIKTQLDAALAGEISPAGQAKVDAIFAAVEANKQVAADAIVANTPAAPSA